MNTRRFQSTIHFCPVGNVFHVIIYRKAKLEAALNDPWWRADADDLVRSGPLSKANSSATLSRTSLGSTKVYIVQYMLQPTVHAKDAVL